MPLSPEERAYVEQQLDECDAALLDKPNLARVFDAAWRAEHRAKMLAVDAWYDVWYPSSYAKPHNDMFLPADWQDRIEEGAAVLLPKFDKAELAHFVQRMRLGGSSTEEELLLARGFASVFGAGAISFPKVNRNSPRPEFHVTVGGLEIEIEAKGMLDSAEVRALNEHALRSGELCWSSFNPRIGSVTRVQQQVKEKLLSATTGDVRVLVFTQYTPWPPPWDVVSLLRRMAASPETFAVPLDKHPLAIAYVTYRWTTGVWLSVAAAQRAGLGPADLQCVRAAIGASFYARSDGLLFDETNDDKRERELIAQMRRIPRDYCV